MRQRPNCQQAGQPRRTVPTTQEQTDRGQDQRQTEPEQDVGPARSQRDVGCGDLAGQPAVAVQQEIMIGDRRKGHGNEQDERRQSPPDSPITAKGGQRQPTEEAGRIQRRGMKRMELEKQQRDQAGQQSVTRAPTLIGYGQKQHAQD